MQPGRERRLSVTANRTRTSIARRCKRGHRGDRRRRRRSPRPEEKIISGSYPLILRRSFQRDGCTKITRRLLLPLHSHLCDCVGLVASTTTAVVRSATRARGVGSDRPTDGPTDRRIVQFTSLIRCVYKDESRAVVLKRKHTPVKSFM